MPILRRTALAAGAASLLPAASDHVRGAIIGAGGRGRYLTGEFKEIGVEMAAVCDVYEPNLQAGLKAASTGARGYDNYKKLLEDKSIDVVVVATPDHWHARMTIDAVEAGKDVYVEKPLAHTIADGFRMIEAVRRTKRIVQVGTQRRSFDVFQQARQIIDSGVCGKVKLVNSWWLNNTSSFRKATLNGRLDWKQWLGNAPAREMSAERFFNWYWFWDYSGGLLVGQAAHVIDAIHWFQNSTYPLAVTASSIKPNIPGAEVPETATMSVEYPEGYLAIFTLGYQAMRYAGVNDQLEQFHGDKARFDVGRESYALYTEDPKAIDLVANPNVRKPGSFNGAARAHIRNFLECVRTRQEPNAPIEVGQYTNVVLCMAMESLRTGRRIRWNAQSRRAEA
ncbi:MAG: Gfo/Idh/MocA family oxidoreductase [Bryobacterales bacterium]|nr:Gfo/Idh/MocA family oxidoreductase [Bryobacterales bacterium]